jgi:uncharacterized protein YndB with AHSA1/START domain
MADHIVGAQKVIAAPPDKVFQAIADYKQRPQWLPPNFSDYKVEKGGKGVGTTVTYRLTVGNRVRDYRITVEDHPPLEPLRGSALTECDANALLMTTWVVTRQGDDSLVTLHTGWRDADGVGGFFERLFARAALKRVYADTLSRLDCYVTGQGDI